MFKALGLFVAVTTLSAMGAFFATGAKADVQQASAILRNADGQNVGTVSFVESTHGEVLVKVQGRNLPPGPHGMHIHAVGQCAPAAFTSAGSHFNPHSQMHGLASSKGPHAGDLPNLMIDSAGNGSFEMVVARFTVHDGMTSILDADGSALVIHAGPDDGITDPTGNSGDRIACGVVTSGAAASAPVTPSSNVTPPHTGDAGLATGGAETSLLLPGLALAGVVLGATMVIVRMKRVS